MKNGIDVSRWQGRINWCEVAKDSNVQFAILKLGGNDSTDGSAYKDSQFDANYIGCKAHGIPCGCYWFLGYGTDTADKGHALAMYVLSMLKGKQFEYPIYLDVEGTNTRNIDGVTDAVYSFCHTIEDAGYYVGIYGSDISTFRDRLNIANLTSFDKWVARYPLSSNCVVIKSCGMRQHSSTGIIKGIHGNVDLDVAYYDFPTIIKNKHLNGF